jgi:RHH-type rel operon transcriptional repressor/antitoxin RelB
MDTTLTIRIPDDTKQSLEQLAEATGRSKSFLALDAIRAYLERESWQVAQIQEAVREADAGDFATSGEVQQVLRKWGLNAD